MEYQLIQASKKFYSMDEFGKRIGNMENSIISQDDKLTKEANEHGMTLATLNSAMEMLKETINQVMVSQRDMRNEAAAQVQEFMSFRSRFYSEYQDEVAKINTRCDVITAQMRDLTYQIQQANKGVSQNSSAIGTIEVQVDQLKRESKEYDEHLMTLDTIAMTRKEFEEAR